MEYLEYASAYSNRPYRRLLKGYRLVDKAMLQTRPRKFCYTCDEFRYGNDLPCLHLVRAGAPKTRAMKVTA